MRAVAWIASALAAAAMIAGMWWATRPAGVHLANAPAAASSASERLPKVAPVAAPTTGPLADVAARVEAQAAEKPSADFTARREALARRTRNGDVDAAGELGDLLLTCDGYVDLGDDDVETMLVEGLALFGNEALQIPAGAPLDAIVDSTKREMARMRATCAGSHGLALSSGERRDAFDMLHRGAQAGIREAMINFAHFAFEDFADAREMLAHPERVRERKREVRGYVERAIAAGEIEALSAAADAYYSGSFLEKSSLLAYAHLYAYARAKGGDAAVARDYAGDLALYGAGLTPEQLADARHRGDALYAACCAAKGGAP